MSRISAIIGLALLAVLFFAINVASDRMLRGVQLDVTEDNLYTLTRSGRAVARSPEEPVTLKFYFSSSLAQENAQLSDIAERVRTKLEGFAEASGGKVELEVIDPEPFSAAEEEAVAEGLRGIPLPSGDVLYFGLVGVNSLDGREVIPLFNLDDPNFERFLEFEIAKMIHTLGTIEKPTVGVISSLNLDGTPPNQMTGQPGQPAWRIVSEMEASFEVERIDTGAEAIPEDVDVLVVMHPKDLSDGLLYAIDQFVLAGGRAMFFVDPLCEMDRSGIDPRNPMSQLEADRSSDLPRLFNTWGISLVDGQVAGDLATGLQMPVRMGQRPENVTHVYYMRLRGEECFDQADPVTGRLGEMLMGTAGILNRMEDAAVEWEPLVTTTNEASPVALDRLTFMADPKAILADFVPSGDTEFVLAARLTGENVPTAFPDGRPSASNGGGDDAEASEPGEGHLAASAGEINVIVVSDVDMLADPFWSQEINLGGISLGYQRVSDNAAFVMNALDQMVGSRELLALRARGSGIRPFTLLEEMDRQTAAEVVSKQTALEEDLQQTEARLNEMLSGQLESGADSLVLPPEATAEVERLRLRRIELQRELRDVLYEAGREKEDLKLRLKLINTLAVPGLLCLFAVGLAGYRSVRRRADRRRGGDR